MAKLYLTERHPACIVIFVCFFFRAIVRRKVSGVKPKLGFLRHIMWLTQLGMSVAAPLVIFILASVWLKNHTGIGGWVVVVGVFLGVAGAVSGLWRSLKAMKQDADREDEKPHRWYNDHE